MRLPETPDPTPLSENEALDRFVSAQMRGARKLRSQAEALAALTSAWLGVRRGEHPLAE